MPRSAGPVRVPRRGGCSVEGCARDPGIRAGVATGRPGGDQDRAVRLSRDRRGRRPVEVSGEVTEFFGLTEIVADDTAVTEQARATGHRDRPRGSGR